MVSLIHHCIFKAITAHSRFLVFVERRKRKEEKGRERANLFIQVCQKVVVEVVENSHRCKEKKPERS